MGAEGGHLHSSAPMRLKAPAALGGVQNLRAVDLRLRNMKPTPGEDDDRVKVLALRTRLRLIILVPSILVHPLVRPEITNILRCLRTEYYIRTQTLFLRGRVVNYAWHVRPNSKTFDSQTTCKAPAGRS